jgi:hypothetical protein
MLSLLAAHWAVVADDEEMATAPQRISTQSGTDQLHVSRVFVQSALLTLPERRAALVGLPAALLLGAGRRCDVAGGWGVLLRFALLSDAGAALIVVVLLRTGVLVADWAGACALRSLGPNVVASCCTSRDFGFSPAPLSPASSV